MAEEEKPKEMKKSEVSKTKKDSVEVSTNKSAEDVTQDSLQDSDKKLSGANLSAASSKNNKGDNLDSAESSREKIKKVDKKVVEKLRRDGETKEKHEERLREMEKELEEKADKEVDKMRWKRLEERDRAEVERERVLESWVPKTQLGRDVKAGKVKDIQVIFDENKKILESQIVDKLLNVKSELLDIGQAKGKFGGGQRRAWRQTQKKTKEGNVIKFSVMACVGDGAGHLGVGIGKAKETLPAKEKAIRKAKLNIQKIRRGCGSYDCSCDELHSIPLRVVGKCSGVTIKLMPAPQGTGLVASDEIKKILRLAGIKDIYTKTIGPTKTTINAASACVDALSKLGGVEI